jgi:hypothetical protein
MLEACVEIFFPFFLTKMTPITIAQNINKNIPAFTYGNPSSAYYS